MIAVGAVTESSTATNLVLLREALPHTERGALRVRPATLSRPDALGDRDISGFFNLDEIDLRGWIRRLADV